ncbi:MAG: HNH endonuclease [Elusimicrobia bacterium]|nr:HNH endonuclease [Elusimicrobiota bacterium]
MEDLSQVTDDGLETALKEGTARERRCCVAALSQLGEFDARGLPEAAGYPTLYAFCVGELGWSEHTAYERVQAARALRRLPGLGTLIEAGAVRLAAIVVLGPYLAYDNYEELLAEARGLGRKELETLAAALDPRPDIPDAVELAAAEGADAAAAAPREARDSVQALSAERVHFGFTGSVELRRKIERARALLWHKDPSGRLEAVIDTLADYYLDRKDPDRRTGLAARAPGSAAVGAGRAGAGRPDGSGRAEGAAPEDRPAAARSRLIPAAVKEEVWERDEGRCAYVSDGGRRCEERAGLEYDHIVPWVLGGRSDSAVNIRLLCRSHNQHAAARLGLGRAE